MRIVQRVLFAVAITLLGYCGFAMADSWMFQRRALRQFEESLHAPVSATGLPAAAVNGMIGRIEVPRLGISVAVVEGSGADVLSRAAGHIPGTGLPGQPGNIGISAHRDTFFRPLRNVRGGDVITIATLRGEYRYRVVSTKIVSPDDVGVLDAGAGEVLTLVTCYPFYFIGAAPSRFIVRAQRVPSVTADGTPVQRYQ